VRPGRTIARTRHGAAGYPAAPWRISCFDVRVPAPMNLPDGLTQRPLGLPDATAVYEVMAAQEAHDTGVVAIEEADIVGDWRRPSFDIGSSTVGVFAGDRLVAYGEVSGLDRGDTAVHPDHRGRGIGTQIAGWMQALARERGASVVGMPVPEGSPGDALLASLGYRVRWTSWVLELPAGASIPHREPPAGYTVREARPEEYEACWTVVEDAFLEWSVRDRQSFADFSASVTQRPGFEPWNLRVAVDPAGEVVGFAQIHDNGDHGYVDKLATRSDQRGRGLAQCLLIDAFAVARAHGCSRAELSTDSRTGALSLYERVGMRVISRWVNRAIDV
jgi:mycothiol synthase